MPGAKPGSTLRLDLLVNTTFPSTWSNACSGVTGHGFPPCSTSPMTNPVTTKSFPVGVPPPPRPSTPSGTKGTPFGGRAGPPDAYLHRDGGSRHGDRGAGAASSPRNGLSADDIVDEVQAWNDRADAELLANEAVDDRTADTERRKAIDGRGLVEAWNIGRRADPGRTLATMSSSFGTLFRVSTFGESHGGGVGVVIDGCPPRLAIDEATIQVDLDRRRPGQSRLVTQRDEADQVEILSGVFEGYTTGTPIALLVRNKDHNSGAYDHLRDVYRPSHADFTYDAKYGFRNGPAADAPQPADHRPGRGCSDRPEAPGTGRGD